MSRGIAWVLKISGAAIGLAGLLLLALVTVTPLGLVDPYPMPPMANVDGPFGRSLVISDIGSLYREDGEGLRPYLERLTHQVADGIVHYWTEGEQWAPGDAAYTRPSIFDNYLLWAYAMLPNYSHFYNYEFLTPSHVVKRGYGFCSQVSRLVWAILREQGINATIINSPQHVVVEADGNILDADYGVFIPKSASEIRNNLVAIDTYYANFPTMTRVLKDVYAGEWTPVDQSSLDYMLVFERRMDSLKWWPPALLLAVGAVLLLVGKALTWRRQRAPYAAASTA